VRSRAVASFCPDSLFPFRSNARDDRNGPNFPSKWFRLEKAGQEVLARAGNIMVARAAFDVSVSLYQSAEIELRQGSRVIAHLSVTWTDGFDSFGWHRQPMLASLVVAGW
jgi:hypothetical protein